MATESRVSYIILHVCMYKAKLIIHVIPLSRSVGTFTICIIFNFVFFWYKSLIAPDINIMRIICSIRISMLYDMHSHMQSYDQEHALCLPSLTGLSEWKGTQYWGQSSLLVRRREGGCVSSYLRQVLLTFISTRILVSSDLSQQVKQQCTYHKLCVSFIVWVKWWLLSHHTLQYINRLHA